MGVAEQNRFVDAARNARTDGGVETAAHMLSGLAMFDMLPALAALDRFSRDRVLEIARRALALGAFQRVEFAAYVVMNVKMPALQPDLPKDQVDDARRYLMARLMPGKSKAGFASYSSMNAAGIQAIDEVMVVTQAIRREFAGSIYKQNGAFKFTPPVMGGLDSSSSEVPVPRGTQWVGMYHVHPDVNTNPENFSVEDMIIARGITTKDNVVLRPALVSYLGTPSGRIKKITPPELLQGAEKQAYFLLGKQDFLR
jgi:hypothetical protein